ncbi:MAG TPA: cytochrome c peroxidase, partial [Planctomycetota bacterium]|nr:cytochrome c peroxidase [Planctomycetota bacterium]
MRKTLIALSLPVLFAGSVLTACSEPAQDQKLTLPSDPKNYGPLEKMENMKVPADNPVTQEKANLGWVLWFDKRLSGDGSRSCYSCHVNEKGLTDGLATNTNAVDGK